MHLEERLITQLLALAPHLGGDHVDEIVRPALFEVALTVADLLRQAEAKERILIFSATQAPSSDRYEMHTRLDAEAEYERRHARCAHRHKGRRGSPYEFLITDGCRPTAWEGGLVAWRAARIWLGLADLIDARFKYKTYTFDAGTEFETVEAAVGSEFLTKLCGVRAQVAAAIAAEETSTQGSPGPAARPGEA